MFETPGSNVTSVHISEEVALGKCSPIYEKSSSAPESSSQQSFETNNDNAARPTTQERAINT